MNAIIFIYWPVLSDNLTSSPLQFSGVTAGHRSVAIGTGDTEENSPELRTVTPRSVSDSLGWVAHQVWKQEWEVVVYLIFLRVTRVACRLHSFFAPSLSVSLSCIKTHFHTYPCRHLLTHIFFVCITPLSSSLTQYIPVILNSKAQVQPCSRVCVSEIVSAIPVPTAVT